MRWRRSLRIARELVDDDADLRVVAHDLETRRSLRVVGRIVERNLPIAIFHARNSVGAVALDRTRRRAGRRFTEYPVAQAIDGEAPAESAFGQALDRAGAVLPLVRGGQRRAVRIGLEIADRLAERCGQPEFITAGGLLPAQCTRESALLIAHGEATGEFESRSPLDRRRRYRGTGREDC